MRILNVQRMSTEDGPGLRTTVFLKGCPLRCTWCHNPESIPPGIAKEWIRQNCIGCGTCADGCPEGAAVLTKDGVAIDPEKCVECGTCVENCPADAMRPLGLHRTVEDLYDELVRDRAYFGSEGGVTLSGGEVLLQAEEAALLAAKLKAAGIGVAIDTAGFAPWKTVERLVAVADLFLYDLKLDDEEKHKSFCGVSNGSIKENLVRLSAAGVRLWIRTPVIPGATDESDNVAAIGRFLKERGIAFERWELCAFNNLARDKYARLGLDWAFKDAPLMTREAMERLTAVARDAVGMDKVRWTGMTKREETHG
ncbi:MAG: glycyl-radical enzyme activating protein [Candidatus Izemoplasmatales bacterium]